MALVHGAAGVSRRNRIANVDAQPDKAYPIEMEITPEGKITVTNDRNQFSKTYTAREAEK